MTASWDVEGVLLEGNIKQKRRLTGKTEECRKYSRQKSLREASTLDFLGSLRSCHPSWRARLRIARWPEEADRWSCPPHSNSHKHLKSTTPRAWAWKCVEKRHRVRETKKYRSVCTILWTPSPFDSAVNVTLNYVERCKGVLTCASCLIRWRNFTETSIFWVIIT